MLGNDYIMDYDVNFSKGESSVVLDIMTNDETPNPQKQLPFGGVNVSTDVK